MSQAARSGSGRRLLSIGEVLSRLQPDFPDLTHSKVRFLESSGLVEPRRTASGYRKFTESDIERIRLILVLQRDHYMPHKAIKEYLDAQDRGLNPSLSPREVPVAPTPTMPTVDVGASRRTTMRLRPAELAATAGVDTKTVSNLETFGLIRASSAGYYDADAVEVATLAGQLSHFGIEPRHLRLFRIAADREISLIEQVTSPGRHRSEDGAAQADEAAREIAGVCLQLHTALVRTALAQLS
ncbi:MAG: MerR family transcriptional regulator [Actinomycetales bacterium]